MEDREDNGVTVLPLATRSLSIESLPPCDYEKDESDFSSRSSTSEMTSVSAQMPGSFVRTGQGQRNSVSFYPSGRLRKGYSTPDIHALGRMYCEANMLNKHSRNSVARSSQSSLNSIREVCSKYQIFDIPLEKRIKRQTQRSVKFGSVGYIRNNDIRSSSRSTMTLPRHKTVVSAIVHTPMKSNVGQVTRSSSIKSTRSGRLTLKDFEPTKTTIYEQPSVGQCSNNSYYSTEYISPKESYPVKEGPRFHTQINIQPISTISGSDVTSHYHDPDSLRSLRQPPPIAKKPVLKKPESQAKYESPKTDIIYSKVVKSKPKILYPKPKLASVHISRAVGQHEHNIYATVNKSMFKVVSKAQTGPKPQISLSKPHRYQSSEASSDVSSLVDCKEETFKGDNSDLELGKGMDNPAFTELCDTHSLEDDEEDVAVTDRDSIYARMETFKPVCTSPILIQGLTDSMSHI